MTQRAVFLLTHRYGPPSREEVKFIGVYDSREEAEAAIHRVRDRPGFCDWPDGFEIDEYPVGQDHWAEGFCQIVPIHVAVVGAGNDRWECVHSERLPGDRFRILDADDSSAGKPLAFGAGQVVRCEERTIDGVPGRLVAVEAVE